MLTIRGTVGRVAVVPDFLNDANITQDTARISITCGLTNFYRHFLESTRARTHFAINTVGVAVQGLNLRDVRTTPIPIPSLEEQHAIASRMESTTRSSKEFVAQLEKLRATKSGLMHDLLTGRVRVNKPQSLRVST